MKLLNLRRNPGAVQLGSVMQLLYKAYACEEMEGGKFLLPGFPVEPGEKESLQPGDKIIVELADGTRLKTTVVNTKISSYTDAVATKLNVRIKPGYYYVIQVPDDFSPEAVNLGVKVFLDDSTAS
jgi:hypothetical protein